MLTGSYHYHELPPSLRLKSETPHILVRQSDNELGDFLQIENVCEPGVRCLESGYNYYFLIPGCFGFIPTISCKTKEILDLQFTVKLLVADAEQKKINSSEENVDQVVLCLMTARLEKISVLFLIGKKNWSFF